MNVTDEIREAVKKRMDDIGMTQYRLEKEFGVSQGSVSRFLNGERYKASDEVLKLFDALGLELIVRVKQ